VRLEALWEERGELLMTTELVEGEGLVAHVGGVPERLRACLAQLARGLETLHAHGFAHGEVTLENLVVEPSGRLVLLGGGLATRWQDAGARVRGAGAYLSPEARQGHVGPETDLYAVGIILREALTRTRPRDAEDPLGTSVPLEPPPTAPTDLRALCVRLLADEPAARTPAADVAAALGAPAFPTAPPATRESLVGRADALEALEDALAAVADGEPHAIWVEGESGIGKSAVLEHFRRRLAGRAQTVVLAGRARRGDAVPFPALDEAIDDLGAYLERLPTSTAEVLVTRSAAHLARLFPSLSSVPAIARGARELDPSEGAAETRRRAFDGLRDLLARLAESRTVVMVLDDLQWIDADSRALLAHLLDGPQAPALLVVGAVRATEDSDELRKLAASLGPRVRRLALGPLTHDESCQLVRARWRGRTALDPAVAARLADEAHGVPFFLEMLAATPEIEGLPRLESGGGLEEVLAARIRMLSPLARRALEIVCLASRPLPVEIVLEASGHRDLREIDALLREPFLRSARSERGWLLEPHHDRLRDAVCRALGEADARDHHRALANALERQSSSEAELFIEHLAAGGDARRATEVALSAARAANDHLAFERAAALFAVALEHGRFDDGERLSLVRERARALQLARRRRQCGEVLLDAAERAPGEATSATLRAEAGIHLLYAGDVLRGLEALGPTLARAGLRVPTTFDETLAATMAALGALGPAMSAPPPEARQADADADVEAETDGEARVDLCLVLAQGLAHIDLRVLPFACQGLVAALEVGDPRRLQRATALFVVNTVEYLPNPFVAPALALCRKLTEADPTPYARALLDAAVAENAHFEGDFLEAEAAFERAEHTLLDMCPEATRELATVRDLAVFVQYAQKGDFKTQLARTQRWLAEADAARDVYHASMLRVAHAIVWIAQDDPARARAELRRAQEQWIGEAGVLEVGAALYHDIIDRYEELDLQPGPPGPQSVLLRSPAAQTPFLGGYIGLQRAWKALRAIAAGRGDEREATALVTEIVVGLRASGLAIWAAVSDALEANLRYLGGEHERAARGLDAAETTFKRMGMACLAACARRRRGEFIEGELGARLRVEADAELHRLGVVDVARWTRAYWSMFDARAARARTADGGPAPVTGSLSPAA
jgi:tetratricopeptide (TPR) repeat protein